MAVVFICLHLKLFEHLQNEEALMINPVSTTKTNILKTKSVLAATQKESYILINLGESGCGQLFNLVGLHIKINKEDFGIYNRNEKKS